MGIFGAKKELAEMEELDKEPTTDPEMTPPMAEAVAAPPGRMGEVTGIYRMAMETVDANLLEKKATISKAVRIKEHAARQAQMVRSKTAKR